MITRELEIDIVSILVRQHRKLNDHIHCDYNNIGIKHIVTVAMRRRRWVCGGSVCVCVRVCTGESVLEGSSVEGDFQEPGISCTCVADTINKLIQITCSQSTVTGY